MAARDAAAAGLPVRVDAVDVQLERAPPRRVHRLVAGDGLRREHPAAAALLERAGHGPERRRARRCDGLLAAMTVLDPSLETRSRGMLASSLPVPAAPTRALAAAGLAAAAALAVALA